MATLYAAGDGTILRFLATAREEDLYPDPPAGTVTTITFDPATNAQALAGLTNDWNAHRVSSGKLQRGGLDVAIAGDGAPGADRKFVKANAPAILAALRAGTATANQAQKAIAFLLQVELDRRG